MAYGRAQRASLFLGVIMVSTSCIAAAALDDGGGYDPRSAATDGCKPFSLTLDEARRIDLASGAETAVYVGVRGAALLEALNQGGEPVGPGEGLLVMRVVGYGQVIVGVIAAGRSMVCDPQLITEDHWESVEAAALRQVAADTTDRRTVAPASRDPI